MKPCGHAKAEDKDWLDDWLLTIGATVPGLEVVADGVSAVKKTGLSDDDDEVKKDIEGSEFAAGFRAVGIMALADVKKFAIVCN